MCSRVRPSVLRISSPPSNSFKSCNEVSKFPIFVAAMSGKSPSHATVIGTGYKIIYKRLYKRRDAVIIGEKRLSERRRDNESDRKEKLKVYKRREEILAEE